MRGRGESRREGGGERGLGNPRSDNGNRLVDAKEGRHQRVANDTNRKTQRPSENVAPCKGPEPKVEEPSPGTGGEGQDRGGRRRKEEAQQTPKELST